MADAENSVMAPKNYGSARCPSCGSDELLSVGIDLGSSPVSFTRCNTCEWKGWEREGQLVALQNVLTLIGAR